ncbi:NADH-quinone oxidoreductase subunit J [Helicobacter sp. 11S02596-1]|uniref:NADH-quinone oxidoreductase subunit J n=1 Tax=Helicobacter sp. 11S02596-1 TaxID=1476194 RepID=UPI000BA63035|nr:NADH-quinone oxidoreductase subunit J [Helicobacter sp. 11S02596-1]PAF44286.1 NADH:ubiquinone oxidoreductase subunit J [Helicobacter sp. 11S02596-1]
MFAVIAFYLFASLSLAMFLVVVTTKNILYAMTALASGMIFISVFFFLLDAEFMGVVQIAVYAGAVIVMYAFGMMFFDSSSDVIEASLSPKTLCVLVFGIALILTLIFGAPIISANLSNIQTDTNLAITKQMSNIEQVGYVLFTKYLIPFEVAAIMLLTAMIAGIATGMRKVCFPTEEIPINQTPTNQTPTKQELSERIPTPTKEKL